MVHGLLGPNGAGKTTLGLYVRTPETAWTVAIIAVFAPLAVRAYRRAVT